MSTASGGTCDLGNFTFGDFSVAVTGGATHIGLSTGSSVVDGVSYLNFETIPQGPGPSSWLLTYSVTVAEGYLFTGIDMSLGQFTLNPDDKDAFVSIGESVCHAIQVSGACSGVVLPGLFINHENAAGDNYVEMIFDQPFTGKMWIQKDIQISAGSTLSDFYNSHHSRDGGDVPEVPEPATMLLFSTALLGLGFMRRKKS